MPTFITQLEKSLAEDKTNWCINKILNKLNRESRRLEAMILDKNSNADRDLLEFLEEYFDVLVKAGVVCKKVWGLYNTSNKI